MSNQSVSLQDKHTFQLPVRCRELVVATDIQILNKIGVYTQEQKRPLLLLGEGSNVLFVEDFTGIVVLNKIKGIEVTEAADAWYLRVGAGENWHKLVCFTLQNNMPGLENMTLIPGCCGAAPIQNIGAYGVEFCDICDYVELLDLEQNRIIKLSASECEFGYRESIFKHQYCNKVITHIGIRLPKQWQPVLTYGELHALPSETISPQAIFEHVCRIRRQKLPDPTVMGNAGSFFKNPIVSSHFFKELLVRFPNIPHYLQKDNSVKLAAGWLIDQCGLKGYRIGGASVHPQQALILVNSDNASTTDMLLLAREVRQKVVEKYSIYLEPEVRFIGAYGEIDAVEAVS